MFSNDPFIITFHNSHVYGVGIVIQQTKALLGTPAWDISQSLLPYFFVFTYRKIHLKTFKGSV